MGRVHPTLATILPPSFVPDQSGDEPVGPVTPNDVSTMSAASGVLSSNRWRRLIPIVFITYSFAYLRLKTH